MTRVKKITAVVLVFSIFISAFGFNAFAEEEVSESMQGFYIFLDDLVNKLVAGIAALIYPPRSWKNIDEYSKDNFYAGVKKEDYNYEGGKWTLGYANASIKTGDELDDNHYVGGSLSVTRKTATDIRDDQKVRTIAISDGRGISIFSVIDGFGICNKDVKTIRARFQKYADENNLKITSINVSALHQHSCVDTFGMNGDIINALFTSSFRNLFNLELPSGQNEAFMENLFTKTVDTMKTAVSNMEEGTLYFGSVNAKEYMHDKRDPQVMDENLNRFRFVPDDPDSKETWLVNAGIHCVGHGAAGTLVTADYPYFMEKYINEEKNANLLYILGAELAITSDNTTITPDADLLEKYGDEGYARLASFGKALAEKVSSISNEKIVDPILNISFTTSKIDIENMIFLLAGKGGLLVNEVYKTGFAKYAVVTEIGYAQFGKDISVAIMPGELAPEIAFGGADMKDKSWTDEDWEYAPFNSVEPNRTMVVFGLTNDQVGYLVTNSNWHSFCAGYNEEIVSCGKMAGASVASDYIPFMESLTK